MYDFDPTNYLVPRGRDESTSVNVSTVQDETNKKVSDVTSVKIKNNSTPNGVLPNSEKNPADKVHQHLSSSKSKDMNGDTVVTKTIASSLGSAEVSDHLTSKCNE